MTSKVGLFFLFFATLSAALIADNVPDCYGKDEQVLFLNNSQVIYWKHHTKNQYHNRGHVKGKLLQVYTDRSQHRHWQVQIGEDRNDTVEIIYNEDFGAVPNVHSGSTIVEACGDYITANKQSGHYPPSPDGALVHWVHRSPSSNHPSGFLVVDGTVCGLEY